MKAVANNITSGGKYWTCSVGRSFPRGHMSQDLWGTMDVCGKTFLWAIGLINLSLTGRSQRVPKIRGNPSPCSFPGEKRAAQPNMNRWADEAALDPTRWVLISPSVLRVTYSTCEWKMRRQCRNFWALPTLVLDIFPICNLLTTDWAKMAWVPGVRVTLSTACPGWEEGSWPAWPQCWLSESLKMWRLRFKLDSQIQ